MHSEATEKYHCDHSTCDARVLLCAHSTPIWADGYCDFFAAHWWVYSGLAISSLLPNIGTYISSFLHYLSRLSWFCGLEDHHYTYRIVVYKSRAYVPKSQTGFRLIFKTGLYSRCMFYYILCSTRSSIFGFYSRSASIQIGFYTRQYGNWIIRITLKQVPKASSQPYNNTLNIYFYLKPFYKGKNDDVSLA